MSRKRKFREDDLAIWRRVKSTVTPLDVLPRKEEAEAQKVERPEFQVSPMPTAKRPILKHSVDFKRLAPTQDLDGLHKSTRRAIKRGGMEPAAKIDLHGKRLEEARSQLLGFLHRSALNGNRVVLVITGKGGHRRLSDFGHETSGVIRRAFPEWMQESEFSRLVSHYTQAHIKHGGDGAWYVFIRGAARRGSQ